MSPRTNLTIQLTALALAALFRLVEPGVSVIVLVKSQVGLLAVLLPTILAVVVLRRARLGALVTVPFLGCAVSLVVASALFPEFSETDSWIPALTLFGLDAAADGLTAGMGGVALVLLLLCAALTPMAVGVTAADEPRTPRRSPRATSPRAWRAAASR